MGSLRRQLTRLTLLAPTTAWAEVCDKERPNWDGLPVGAFSEALFHFTRAPLLICLALTLWAVWKGCIGPYTLSIALCAAICIATPLTAYLRRKQLKER